MIDHIRPICLACLALAGALAPVAAAEQTIRNGGFWKDTAGTPIYSQSGGMLKIGAKYYWYGVKYAEAVAYAQAPRAATPQPHFDAVTAYSSTDLVNWTFEGDVLTSAGLGDHADPKAWLGRMGVVYNKRTRKYVLLIQYGGKGGAGVLFATGDTPTGPFVFQRLQAQIENAAAPATGDQTLFIDDDGKPYLIFSSSGDRRALYVAPLRARTISSRSRRRPRSTRRPAAGAKATPCSSTVGCTIFSRPTCMAGTLRAATT